MTPMRRAVGWRDRAEPTLSVEHPYHRRPERGAFGDAAPAGLFTRLAPMPDLRC